MGYARASRSFINAIASGTGAANMTLVGKRVLIVENEYIIAEYLALEFTDKGAEVIGRAETVEAAASRTLCPSCSPCSPDRRDARTIFFRGSRDGRLWPIASVTGTP